LDFFFSFKTSVQSESAHFLFLDRPPPSSFLGRSLPDPYSCSAHPLPTWAVPASPDHGPLPAHRLPWPNRRLPLYLSHPPPSRRDSAAALHSRPMPRSVRPQHRSRTPKLLARATSPARH